MKHIMVVLAILLQVMLSITLVGQTGGFIDLSQITLNKPNSVIQLNGQKAGNQTLNVTLVVRKEKLVRVKFADAQTLKLIKTQRVDGPCDSDLCYTFQVKSCVRFRGICFCMCGAFKKPDHSPR